LSFEICNEWGVGVADVFENAGLDTRDTEQMTRYIIGGNGSHPTADACREFYIPVMAKKLNEVLSSDNMQKSSASVTIAVTSCNSRAKMLAYGSEYQPKLILTYDSDIETIPEKDGAVYSVITKAVSDNPVVDISRISNSANITGYQVTVARDNEQISQTVIERGNNINGLDSIDVTASEGDDIEVAPIYEYKKTLSYGSGVTLADVFPDGRYNITVTNGSANHTDLYVNGYMAANNIDQNGAGRSVSTGSTYTANDIRAEGNEQKITIQTKDSANSLSYVKIVKSPSVAAPRKKIFITGDSLVANYYGGNEGNYLGNTQTGWGQVLGKFIDTDKYEVVNLANAGYWAATLKTTAYPGIIYNAAEGDIFLLESGVNDYWNPDSKGATAGLDTNRNTMKTAVTEMVQGAKNIDLPIILVNPNAMPSRHDAANCFSDVMLEVSKEQNVPSIDLSALSSKVLTDLYYDENTDTFKNNIGNNLGVIKGKATDYTHSSYLGAMKYASIVGTELYKLGCKDMFTDYTYTKNDSMGNEIICKIDMSSEPEITPSGKSCVRLTVEYNIDKTLKSINTEKIDMAYIESVQNTDTKKAFYWNSLAGMRPVSKDDISDGPDESPKPHDKAFRAGDRKS
jgi:lysophospholipase L1-like esterase